LSKDDFEAVWTKIKTHEGEVFHTKKGLDFTFGIRGNYFYPSRTKYAISKADIEKAYKALSADGPGDINYVRGPSYVWAVLHDDRIVNRTAGSYGKPFASKNAKRIKGGPRIDSPARSFERRARQSMGRHFKVELAEIPMPGIPKRFDMVSPDGKVVGDAKYLTLVRGQAIPPAKFSMISEYVWLLEHVPAGRKFLVFGNQRKVPEEWLKRYGKLVTDVEFYFLNESGRLDRLL
jgi:hypothetical protein